MQFSITIMVGRKEMTFTMDSNEFNKGVGERIYNLRKRKNMSRVDLGTKLGLHETTIKKYEDGGIKSLGTDKLKDFAIALDTTIEYLMGWGNGTSIFVAKETGILRQSAFKKSIPVLGKISAGLPLLAIENIERYEEVEDETMDYALIVQGDSMIGARIYPGDVLFVSRDVDYQNGDIVVALINGYDATVKRFYKYADEIILRPENPTMKELHYNLDEVTLLGKVKEVKFKV